MDNKIFYTYKIYNKIVDKFYFGSRTISNHIDILNGYNTSSKVVHNLIKTYGLDSFVLVEYKLFDDMESAIKFEDLYLKSIVERDRYLNINFSSGGAVIKSQTHNRLFNEELNEYMYYPKNLDIPDGWIKKVKNPPPTRKGIRKYIDPNTNETYMVHQSDALCHWVLYSDHLMLNKPPRKNIFITNGIENTKICKLDDLPDGWWVGKTVNFTKHSITNGYESKYVERDSVIPDGWYRGSHNKRPNTSGMIKITNGHDEKLIKTDDDIPIGWFKGAVSGKFIYRYDDIVFYMKKDLISHLNTTPTKFDRMLKRGDFGDRLKIINRNK